jgi:hypothetical protein
VVGKVAAMAYQGGAGADVRRMVRGGSERGSKRGVLGVGFEDLIGDLTLREARDWAAVFPAVMAVAMAGPGCLPSTAWAHLDGMQGRGEEYGTRMWA